MLHKRFIVKILAILMLFSLIPANSLPVYAEPVPAESMVTDNAERDENAEEVSESDADASMKEIKEAVEDSGEAAVEDKSLDSAEAATSATEEEDTADTAGTFQSEEDTEADSALAATEAATEELVLHSDPEETYPAFSYIYDDPDSNAEVNIGAPEGAFPEGIQVQVKRVSAGKILDAIRKGAEADAANLSADDIVAYDFEFYKGDEHNLEPQKEITVTFRNLSLDEGDTVSAYHLKNTNANAEKVVVSDINTEDGMVELKADAFSIYAIVSTPAADTDGKIWIDDDDTTTYGTINEAVAAASNNATIHIKGKFGENGSAATGATITKNITLDVAGDTTMTGNGSANGITLTSGTKIHASNGNTLTMTNFGTAFIVNKGAEINDGTYVFRDNQSTTRGIYIDGRVIGSTNRDSVKITADDKYETNFYSGNATFENATLDITSQTWTWKDAVKLNMKNAAMTLSGFGQGFYVDGGSSIVNSYLYMKKPGLRWGFLPWGSTGMTFQNGASTVKGSTIRVDYGSNAGISIGLGNSNPTMTFENSTLDFRNGGGSSGAGGAGGLNVNNGNITLSNTTIKGNGDNSGALFGAQTNGTITLTNNSLVETPAFDNADNGLGQTGTNYVVTGGSHLVKYASTYLSSTVRPAIPTNGAANGNEKLDYVTLADTSVNNVTVLNKQSSTYDYAVDKASSDGKKYIWAPTATVTFKVNPATEKFDDGSTADKTFATVRGNQLALAAKVQRSDNDVITNGAFPGTPTNTDSAKKFLGWYVEGTNTAFETSSQVKEDITVVPKWTSVQVKDITLHDISLYGDILANNNTEHGTVMEIAPASTLTYTGRLYVSPVQDQINTMKRNFQQQGGDVNGITTKDIKSTFTARLTFPTELTVPADPTATLSNTNVFEITGTEKTGNNVTVTMALKKDYKKFTDLYNDIISLPQTLDVNISGVQLGNGGNGTQYTVKGEVKGIFTGTAMTNSGADVRNYDFSWKGVQLPSGKDATQAADDNNTIQHTIKVVVPEDMVTFQDRLAGDILVGENTEHDAAMDVNADDDLTFTGRLDVTSIKQKIDSMANNFADQGGNADGIQTKDIESTFTAKLSFPNELMVPDTPTARLTDNKLFKIKSVTKTGNTVAVTMELINKNYTMFKDLRADVTAVPDILNVDVPGIKVADTVQDDALYTVKGEVSGTFTGTATTSSGNHIRKYNFSWIGVQTPDGRDAIQDVHNDPDSIQFTVKAHKPTQISFEEMLPGDILIGEDTGHDALHEVSKGDTLTYTGRLYVQPVKQKIEALKSRYTGNTDNISTKDIESTFVTELRIPDGLIIPETVTATLTRNDLFEITNVIRGNNVIKITMSLKKKYSKFTDLFNDVEAVPVVLNVDVPGIKVADYNAAAARLTVKGTVTGAFTGKAIVPSGKSELYDFKWTAVQCLDPNGQDFILNGDINNKTIQYTVKVKESTKPNTNENPSSGSGSESGQSSSNNTSSNGRPTSTSEQPSVIQTIAAAIAPIFGAPDVRQPADIQTGNTPDTGDHSHLAAWFAVMTASALALGVVILRRRHCK